MMDTSLSTIDVGSFLNDFCNALNAIPNSLVEIALADKGTSKFNRAMYFAQMTPNQLQKLCDETCNVSFLAGCNLDRTQVPLEKMTKRAAKDCSVHWKSIVSVDIDFKDFDATFAALHAHEKSEKAKIFFQSISEQITKIGIPVWLAVFSGNGIHLHFRLRRPLNAQDGTRYKLLYADLLSCLELAFEGTIPFDKSCSNAARLLRLPLSTNWKDASRQVKTEILYYYPQADATQFFERIKNTQQAIGSKRHKHKVYAKLSLMKVLERFKYQKVTSLRQNGQRTVCSSPFTNDSNPSFYYDEKKDLFFDFSSGKGGDLFNLIADLANLDCQKDFKAVLKIASHIAGETETNQSSQYILREDGVWFSNASAEDPESNQWICSPLEVLAYTRDSKNNEWGRLLSFQDKDGLQKNWAMPMELSAGEGLEIRKELLKRGLEITTSKTGRHHLLTYLQTSSSKKRARCVDRIGWHDDFYLLPDQTFRQKDIDEEVVLQSEGDLTAFRTKDSLENWQRNIADNCKGNSRLLFVLAFAFAPPLLKLTGEESGGIHLVGPSSIGKTLALRIAGSVWGGGGVSGFVQKWRATVNGLENLAMSRCDTLLILDEIAEINAKDAGLAAYMLANGAGKRRLSKNGEPLKIAEWRTLFLSSGEISLGSHLEESNTKQRGGQTVRLVDLDSDAGKGLGVFDQLNSFSSAVEFADTMRAHCSACYGTAIIEYLRKLASEPNLVSKIRVERDQFSSTIRAKNLNGQILRVAKRFSLVAAAGSLACEFGVLPFSKMEIHNAVHACFSSWLKSQSDHPDFETNQILSQIRNFLQQNGCSQFPDLNDPGITNFSGKCAGFRKRNEQGEVEWLVLNEVFRKEICRGLDFRLVMKVLNQGKFLRRGGKGSNSMPVRLPHFGLVRVYQLRSSLMETDEPVSTPRMEDEVTA